MELYEETIKQPSINPSSEEGQPIIRPKIIGGSMEGTGIRSNINGARLEIYPESDKTIGTAIYDDAGAVVFRVLIGGTDVGDVVIGDYAGNQGIFYDKSAGTITFKGGGIITDHGALSGLDDNDHGAVYYTETEIDNFAVKLTGNQNVAGVKAFSDFPTTPSSAPSTDYQMANKKYVDDNAGGDIPITLPFSAKTGAFSYIGITPIQTITYNPTTKTIVAMAALQGEYGEAFICRYGTNGVEGNFTLLDAFEMDIGAYYTFYGSVQVGNYIYTSIDIEGGAPEEIIRRTDLDGANGVNMTISGNDDLNMQGMLVTDGTYIYIRFSTTQYYKLTISGTTLTKSGAITFSNGFQIDNGFGCDRTTLFGFDGGDNNIYGFTASDGAVTYQQAIAYPQEIDGILYINSKFYTATVGYGSEGSNFSHPTSIHLSRINIAAY